jgi:hypothetical protein
VLAPEHKRENASFAEKYSVWGREPGAGRMTCPAKTVQPATEFRGHSTV